MFMRGMIFPGGREPVLQGDGVYLRYPQMSDFAAWARAAEANPASSWRPGSRSGPPTSCRARAFRRRIRRYQREIRSDLAYPFFVFRKADDLLIGGCTLSNVRRGVTQSAASATGSASATRATGTCMRR